MYARPHCMMTGLFPSDSNSFGNTTAWDGSNPTWGSRLREAGYQTWASGKLDLNPVFDIGLVRLRLPTDTLITLIVPNCFAIRSDIGWKSVLTLRVHPGNKEIVGISKRGIMPSSFYGIKEKTINIVSRHV